MRTFYDLFDKTLLEILERCKINVHTNINFSREGGDMAHGTLGLFINYKSPQSFIMKFSNRRLLLKIDWLIHLVGCSNVSTYNFNLQKG